MDKNAYEKGQKPNPGSNEWKMFQTKITEWN
jgi:hypothetical protein